MHLVSGSNCNIVNNAQNILRAITNNVRFTFGVDDTTRVGVVYN